MSAVPRVVLVAAQVRPRLGMESALLHLAEALQSAGVDVRVVSLSGPDDPDWPTSIDHHDLGRGTGRSLRASVLLRRLVREDPAAHWIGVGLWAYVPLLAVAPRSTAVTAWEHSLLPWRLANDVGVRRHAMLARRLLPRAEHVVAVSPSVARTTTDLAPRVQVTVIPNVVEVDLDDARSRLGRDAGYATLLSLGSLREVKDVASAIDALALLPETARLRIAGDGPSRADLVDRALSLGLADRVEFLGHVDDPTALLRTSDVLIHPAHCETFGYSLLEASAARLPVIVRDAPAMNDMVPRHAPGAAVANPSAQGFADAVRQLLDSPPSEADFDAAHTRITEDFGSEYVRDRWVSLITR